jgi:Domain of unknown function (DUF4124)
MLKLNNVPRETTTMNATKIITIATLMLLSSYSLAAINKCTGADGKVVFSDQPCATGQGAASVKPTVEAPAFKGSLADKQAQCKKLTIDFALAMEGRNKTVKTEADLAALLKTLETQCKGIKQPEEIDDARRPKRLSAKSKDPQVIDAQCMAEGHVIEQERPKQNIATPAQRKAFAQLETSFTKSCRYE